jgi:hypothetical protein
VPISFDQVELSPHASGHTTAGAWELTPEIRARATRVVAATAVDARECATLLDMLGLSPEDSAIVPPSPRRGS